MRATLQAFTVHGSHLAGPTQPRELRGRRCHRRARNDKWLISKISSAGREENRKGANASEAWWISRVQGT